MSASADLEHRAPMLDDYVYLGGFPPIDDFLSFVKSNRTETGRGDTRRLTEEWRAANDYLKRLERDEAKLAASNTVAALQPSFAGLRQQVLDDPVVQRSFDIVEFDVGLIDLAKVSVFQKHLNFTYVNDLVTLLGDAPSFEDIFRFCLLDPPQPTVKFTKVAANGYVFVSPSNDLRFLGSALLEPHQVTGYPLPGRAAGVVGLVAGPGANCLSVTAFEGRLILNNGTHRAAALYQSGQRVVPAIVQYASRREELDALFSSRMLERVETYLDLPRPPLFKDYFDPHLARAVQVPRRLTQVKITFGWESIEIPVV